MMLKYSTHLINTTDNLKDNQCKLIQVWMTNDFIRLLELIRKIESNLLNDDKMKEKNYKIIMKNIGNSVSNIINRISNIDQTYHQ